MIKVITLFALLLILGLGIYLSSNRSQPHFEGEGAALREWVWKYDHAEKNSKERLNSAYFIKANQSLKPSELKEDQNSILSAIREVDEVSESVRSFEARLTPADIALITEDDPQSFFKLAGFYSSLRDGQDCTPEAFQKLKKSLTPAEQENAILAQALIEVYKNQFTRTFTDHVIALINRDPRFANENDKRLARTYYALILEGAEKPADLSEYIRQFEDDLIAAGVPKEKLRSYVFALGLKSPECVGRFNTRLPELMKAKHTEDEAHEHP